MKRRIEYTRFAAIYARTYSHEKGLEPLDKQIVSCRYYAKHNYTLYLTDHHYIDREIDSQEDLEQFKNLVSALRFKQFNVIIVHSLDRLSRSIQDILDLKDLLDKYGIILFSLTEGEVSSRYCTFLGAKLREQLEREGKEREVA